MLTLSGTVSDGDEYIIKWGAGDVHSATYEVLADAEGASTSATALASAFNTYVLGAASATTEDAEAIAVGDKVVIFAGTYSGTDGLTVDIKGGSYHAGLEVDVTQVDTSSVRSANND